jgi:ankyrin repeat protein
MADAVYSDLSTDALVASIENENIDGVRRSLREGADPNGVRGMDGRTALMRAAGRRLDKAVVLLIDAGADISRENADGEDAKCVAAAKGYTDIVTLITVTTRLRDEREAEKQAAEEFRRNLESMINACKLGVGAPIRVTKPLQLKGGGE